MIRGVMFCVPSNVSVFEGVCHRSSRLTLPILLVAPHTDDVELGCGGTVARAVEGGANVYVVVFSTVEESVSGEPVTQLQDEFIRSMKSLGVRGDRLIVEGYPVRRLHSYRQEVLDKLIELERAIEPKLILAPGELGRSPRSPSRSRGVPSCFQGPYAPRIRGRVESGYVHDQRFRHAREATHRGEVASLTGIPLTIRTRPSILHS